MNDSSNRAKILVVDDSQLIRKSAAKILDDEFDVVQACDGEEAWRIICEDELIQVVFSDLDMPKLDGFGLLERIRTNNNAGIAELPVVIVTGAEKDEDAKHNALERGATDFITKPFKSTDIIARARAHADYQRTTRALANAAAVDSITGLPNQKAFIEALQKDLSFCHRHQHPAAVAVFEIDDFKTLFLDVGRQGADVIVKEIAKVISKAVRMEDTVSRHSMARFVVSLPTAKPEGLGMFAERILSTVAKFNIRRKGEPISVAMSCGIVALNTVSDNIEAATLIETADGALDSARVHHRTLEIRTLESTPATTVVSIDALLADITQGNKPRDEDLMAVIEHLKPLMRALTAVQRQKLLELH